MYSPIANVPPIVHVIPKEAAYAAVCRGVEALSRERDPAVRRRLEDLIFHAKEPSSRHSVSAVETLMRWGSR